MTIEYSILAALIALIYAVIVAFAPDFPVSPELLLTFLIYVLAKLGVIVVGLPIFLKVKSLFAKRR